MITKKTGKDNPGETQPSIEPSTYYNRERTRHNHTYRISKTTVKLANTYTTLTRAFFLPADLDVDPEAVVIVNAVITNVGGAGYFDNVVDMIDGENMACPSFADACVTEVRL